MYPNGVEAEGQPGLVRGKTEKELRAMGEEELASFLDSLDDREKSQAAGMLNLFERPEDFDEEEVPEDETIH